jgi:hypothetical protein
MPYFGGSWILPILCLLVMVIMMLACHGMRPRCGHGCARPDARRDDAPTAT